MQTWRDFEMLQTKNLEIKRFIFRELARVRNARRTLWVQLRMRGFTKESTEETWGRRKMREMVSRLEESHHGWSLERAKRQTERFRISCANRYGSTSRRSFMISTNLVALSITIRLIFRFRRENKFWSHKFLQKENLTN